MARYKEGVDYEMVDAKGTGGTAKTRRFFTKVEKEARKAPKAEPAKAVPKKSTPSISRAETKPKPKANPRRSKEGPAFEKVGRGDGPSLSAGPKGPNPITVAGTGASVAAAAVAASRFGGARPTIGKPTGMPKAKPAPKPVANPSRRAFLTGSGETVKPEIKTEKPKAGTKPRSARGGGRVGGTGGGGGRNNVDKALDPLNLMNKGGMVKKKCK